MAPGGSAISAWLEWLGGAILAFWLLVALVGRYLAPYGQADIVSNDNFASASAAFLLGGDYIGRDILSRLINGAGTTLGMGVAATVLAQALASPLASSPPSGAVWSTP